MSEECHMTKVRFYGFSSSIFSMFWCDCVRCSFKLWHCDLYGTFENFHPLSNY